MKKLIVGLALMLMTTVSYAKEFVCTGYLDGSQVGEQIKVNDSKRSVAETKAKSRMQKAGLKVGFVQCD